MSGGSVYLNGAVVSCPEHFNAAAWCLGADVDEDLTAFLAVDPEQGVLSEWSFEELRERVLRAAGAFHAAGVKPGDRVVLMLGDVLEFPVAYFGAIAAGAIATPLSSQLSEGEVTRILESVDPSVVVGGAHGTMAVHDLADGPLGSFAETRADDPALLVFTSGSSGRPKGVLHAHRAFWARQTMHDGWHGIGPGDRVMHAGAFNWTYTLGVGLADTWSVGGTAILNAGARTPEVWPELSRAYRPTVFAAAPAVYRRVLKYGDDLASGFASLRHAVTAGEALSPEIGAGWRKATGKPILEALGMSEVSTYVSTPPGVASEVGVVGWPQPGRHVAVLGDDGAFVKFGETGVLAVHRNDPGLTLGYWKDKAATKAAYSGDWFLTGDMVRMREDGAISYAGRRDDQMNAQGYRVDPGEVETALVQCEGVSECGVTEIQIDAGLSVIAAWLVPEDRAGLTRSGVMAAISDMLADYKQPRAIYVTDSLPRTANGKLIRRKLPELSRAELEG